METRPTPWRQAVDLANMMLCLALRSSPRQVYQRARRQFTDDEISEGFAAAHGLALPSQLRHLIRAQGRDLHAEFQTLLPDRPRRISIQRWSPRRVGLLLLTAILLLVLGKAASFVLVNNDVTVTTLQINGVDCDRAGTALAAGPGGAVRLRWCPACTRCRPAGRSPAPTSATAGRSSPSTTTGSANRRSSSG